MLRIDQQLGRPVLIEFWDFCRPSSLRTLPYVKAWHERYSPAGLRVIGVHTPGFAPARDNAAAREAVARLGIEHAVLLDPDMQVWNLYENAGWPARYLFDQELRLVDFHYGEGAYAETERAIQELLGDDREPVAPVHPEDDPDALIAVPTPDQPGAYSGPYEAGTVWAILGGPGRDRGQRPPRRGRPSRRPSDRRARPPHRRRAGPEHRRRRDLPRRLLQPRSGRLNKCRVRALPGSSAGRPVTA